MKKYLAVLFWILSAALASAEDAQIIIDDHRFKPPTLIVKAGTKVTWINRDDDPHTIADGGDTHLFHSGALDTNETYSYIFSTPGTYGYFCTMHTVMQGKITVMP